MFTAYFDIGTTNTRLYVFDENLELMHKSKSVTGSKDVAISGSNYVLKNSMAEMLGAFNGEVAEIYASGMVTSPYGLKEIPHVQIPVSVEAFAREIVTYHEEFLNQDINLVPGIKTFADKFELKNNTRGEEIEAIGMISTMNFSEDSSVAIVFPGSHTHTIYVNRGQIEGILSCFTGEIYHALRTSTILSPILNVESQHVNGNMVREGYKNLKLYGFNRAIYIGHAMNIFDEGNEIDRFSYCEGVINGDMRKSLEYYCSNVWNGCHKVIVLGDRITYQIYKELLLDSEVVKSVEFHENDENYPYSLIGMQELIKLRRRENESIDNI